MHVHPAVMVRVLITSFLPFPRVPPATSSLETASFLANPGVFRSAERAPSLRLGHQYSFVAVKLSSVRREPTQGFTPRCWRRTGSMRGRNRRPPGERRHRFKRAFLVSIRLQTSHQHDLSLGSTYFASQQYTRRRRTRSQDFLGSRRIKAVEWMEKVRDEQYQD
jgi:hypothetical protein